MRSFHTQPSFGLFVLTLFVASNDAWAIGSLRVDPPSSLNIALDTCEKATRVVQFTNAGQEEAVVTAARIRGSSALAVYDYGSTATFASGGAHAITVVYTPTAPGTATGTITITYEYSQTAIDDEKRRIANLYDADVDRRDRQLTKLKSDGPDLQPINLAQARAELDWDKDRTKQELDVSRARALANITLPQEKANALDELRRGLYCSKCHRPKSQIEREEHVSFASHLASVQGAQEPATKEMLDKTAREYDQKIAAAAADATRLQQALDAAKLVFAKSLEDFDQRRKGARKLHDDLVATLDAALRAATQAKREAHARLDTLFQTKQTATASVSASCKQ